MPESPIRMHTSDSQIWTASTGQTRGRLKPFAGLSARLAMIAKAAKPRFIPSALIVEVWFRPGVFRATLVTKNMPLKVSRVPVQKSRVAAMFVQGFMRSPLQVKFCAV